MEKMQLILLSSLFSLSTSGWAEDLQVFHATSLGKAMGEIAKTFKAETGITINLTSGGSGALRQRIEKGEKPDLFASADMENPKALASKGLAQPPVVFTHNTFCLITRKALGVNQNNMIDKALDPNTKLLTSTPGKDPSGDYAWKLFDLMEKARPGSADKLKAKATKVVGDASTPVNGKRKYLASVKFDEGADIFPAYKTSAQSVASEIDYVEMVKLPSNLAINAEYGLAEITGAKKDATKLKEFILGSKGQSILSACGFGAQ